MACTHKFNYLASCFVSQFRLDFSIKDFNDQTALHYATLLEDTSILQLILNKGVDINSRNSGGEYLYIVRFIIIKTYSRIPIK
ncbi:MAG: hypothetical protein ACE1S7_04745 [Candidatus Tisiphia sp.]